MIACSDTPIPIDMLGLAKLTSGLTRVEERLQLVIMGFGGSAVSGNSGDTKANTKNNNYL